MLRGICILLLGVLLAVPAGAEESRTAQDIIEEMAVYYGMYGDDAIPEIETRLNELEDVDAGKAAKWREIMTLWQSVNKGLDINIGILPDGLPDTDELCMVALGFQLNPDGSMRDELVERLRVLLASAQKYPNAYIVCTGGGTAADNPTVSEAGKMAAWLMENGISQDRIIIEDRSQTTAQNAMFTLDILAQRYPQVSKLAIVSSDYHIATGTLLFGAETVLRSDETAQGQYTVISNAAWAAPSGSLSSMFQAGALIELSGDVETAYEIYYATYDIHELPPLSKTAGSKQD